MKKIEWILLGLMIISIALDIANISGAGVLMFLILGSTSIIYFIGLIPLSMDMSVKELLKNNATKGISVPKMMGIFANGYGISSLIAGALFKFTLLPGYEVMISTGSYLLVGITIVIVFKWFRTNKDLFYKKLLIRNVVYLVFAAGISMVSYAQLLEWNFPNDPEMQSLMLQQKEDPTNLEVQEKLDLKWRERMDQ